MTCVIGIGGGTGAGKTTVVRVLRERLGGVSVLDVDSYYLDRSGISPDERSRLNYDEPLAIEVGLLLDHLKALASGRPVAKPCYSFESHTRIGAQTVLPAPLIVVDGLFTLWWGELRTLLDLRVFVDAPPDVRLARRISRDILERGRDVDSVLTQYLSIVRPMHDRYIEPTRYYADLVVTNVGAVEEWAERVVSAVEGLASQPAAGARNL